MSTVEKLLVQIFERKNSIIEQVKQQTDLYSQHLASKLLIEGITPPPWLWNTSLSSNLKELNKDELISEILLPRAWPSAYYPNSRYSIYNTTGVTGDNGELSDGVFVETYASSKDLHAGEGPSSRAVYHDNNTEDVLKSIPELDVRVTLPQDETDTRAESTSDAPDQSLAKIQRSKSRQKALKLRNSANTKARSQSSIKCRYDVTSIGIDFSASVSEQVSESYKFPEASMLVSGGNGLPAERSCPNQENRNDNYTGRVTRSSSCSIKRNCMSDYSKADNYSDIAENVMSSQKNMHAVASNGINMSMLLFEQENLVNKSPKISEPCMINTEPYAVQESSEGDHQKLEKGVDVFTGGVTRSRSSAKQQNYVYDSFEVNSSSDIANKNCGGQAQPTVDLPNQSVKVVNLSDITDKTGQDVCNATVRGSSAKKKKLTGIYSGRTTRSMSSTQKCSITSETLQVDASTYSAKVNSNIIAQTSRETLEKLVDTKKHLELVQPSIYFDNRSSKPQCCSGNEVITNLDKISSIARASGSGTKSAALQKSSCENQDIQNASHDNIILTGPEKCDADNQLGNAEADSLKSHIPQSSPSETNGRIGSERLVPELPSDCSMLVKPKQLNFDDMEECNLNEYTHCTSGDENLDIAIKEIGCTPIDHFSLKEKLSSSSSHTIFSEKQSTLEQDIYSKSNRLSSCRVEFTTQEPDRSKIDASDTEVHASKSSLDDPEALQCFENSNISPEEDVMLASTFNNSDANHHHMKLSPIERSNSLIEPYVEVGVSGFKRCDEGTAASCAGKSKTMVTPCSTSLTNRTTGDYKKCLAKEVANEDPITSSFAAGGQAYIQGAGVDDENFSLESKEIQIAMNSSLLERKFRSTKVSSWPQVKRRKLEDQQSNCFSASRNSQTPRLCNIKMASGSIDLHSIEGQAGVVLKEDASGDNIISELCPIMDSCVPEGLDLTLIASHDCMVEETGRGDPVDLMFDADGCYKPNEQEDAATTSNAGILQVSSESKGTVGDFCDSIAEVKDRDVPEDPGDSMFDTAGCYKTNEQADAATISNDGILQVLSESKETVGDFCDSIIGVKGRNVPADPGDLTFDTDGWYKRNEQSDAATISNDGILQVSSESKETVGNFCDSIIEVKGRDVPAGPNFDSCEYSNEQNFQTASMLENNISLVNNESLCTGSIVLKSSSHMLEDSLYPHSLVHSSHDEVESTGIDDSMPVFEGFVIDPPGADGELDIAGVGINFEALDLPTTTIERASILEQICRSASTHKSLSHLSSALNLHRSHTLYQSLPEGLEHMDFRSTSLFSEDIDKQSRASTSCDEEEVGYSAQGISYPDCLGYSGAKFRWKSGSPYASPVGKLWERTSFHSGSSEKQLNSNPELTCFPIKEDSTISEENENVDKLADEIQDDIDSLVGNSHAKRQPLFDVTAEACLNAPASVSAAEKVQAGGRMDSAKSDVGFSGTRNKAKRKLPSHCRNTSVGKENQSLCATGKKKEKHSHIDGSRKPNLSAATSLRRNEQKLSEKGYNRHNNIISNVTSFIPLVQQKQAATMCTGKKDIKVKALEAAEAAKRLEEKKEIERKKRKEEMKLKRAQLEQENLRQLELNKQKKEEERKKKDAAVLAKKRARAEEEKNDKEKKRKRIEELRRQQNDQEEKLRARKLEIEKKCSAIDEKAISMKENDDKLNISHTEKEIGDSKGSDKPVSELRQAEILKIDNPVSTISHESLDASVDHSQHEKVIHANLDKPGKDQNFTAKEPKSKSYEISPYKCSDDEGDEDEEDQPMRKFIPSWASKSCVALVLPLQQEIDPDFIFPPESFCSMDEVLLPRRVQQKQTAL